MVSMPVSQMGACKETMDRLVSRLSLRRVATSGKAACPRLLGDGERALFTWQGSGWSQGQKKRESETERERERKRERERERESERERERERVREYETNEQRK